MNFKKIALLLLLVQIGTTNFIIAQSIYNEKGLIEKFIMVENGGEILIPEGNYELTRSLWLDGKENITIRGEGKDKTILSFSEQTDGAEGIKITNSKNIIIKDLAVNDASGDAIKVQDTNSITFKDLNISWTGKPSKDNGAYGLYPVLSSNVLIENCSVNGASDAGIYVGQSEHIIVRNNTAFENVAGIEIENSDYADVYQNHVYNNTGGILVFDLPGLIKKKGEKIRIFENRIENNNYKNFAPKGNIVGKVPPGTGVMILSSSDVEIFSNNIINNRSVGTGIVSYYMTELPIDDDTYYPYPINISIHDNNYKRERVRATTQGRMGKMFRFKLKFGKDVPHIIYDGILDEKKGGPTNPMNICVSNNSNESFANIDAENDFKNISRSTDRYACKISSVEPVSLDN